MAIFISGQEWQFLATHINIGNFTIPTDILWSRMAISHCYWHLVVKNGNFTLLLTSSGQEWQFHIATDMLVVKNGNFTLLLTSSGQEWQFHTATDTYSQEWEFHTAMTPSGQEWQFHIATDI